MRAAKLDTNSLTLYTDRLVKENTGDVIAALQKLAELPREQFETAMPGIAEILALVNVERISRENRSTAKRSERLVKWVCPTCKAVQSGFPSTNASLDRRCYKKVWDQKQERAFECGAAMQVVFDYNEGGNLDMVPWEQPAWMGRAGQ